MSASDSGYGFMRGFGFGLKRETTTGSLKNLACSYEGKVSLETVFTIINNNEQSLKLLSPKTLYVHSKQLNETHLL